MKPTYEELEAELETARARIAELEATPASVDDFAMMLARLVHAWRKGAPVDGIIEKAEGLLKRKRFSPCRSESANGGTFNYLVSFGGGAGPDVWDSEFHIDGNDILDATTRAKAQAEESGGWVFSIEQDDYPDSTRETLQAKLRESEAALADSRILVAEGQDNAHRAFAKVREQVKQLQTAERELQEAREDRDLARNLARDVIADFKDCPNCAERDELKQQLLASGAHGELLRGLLEKAHGYSLSSNAYQKRFADDVVKALSAQPADALRERELELAKLAFTDGHANAYQECGHMYHGSLQAWLNSNTHRSLSQLQPGVKK